MKEKRKEHTYLEFALRGDVGAVKFHVNPTDSVEVHCCGQELVRADARARTRELIVDFSGLRNVPSGLFAALVLVFKQMRPRGARLRVCGLRRDARSAFNILNLHQLMTAHDTLEEALAAARASDEKT